MPYKRNYKRKRGPIKKRNGRSRFKRAGASVGSAAYSALKIAKRLKDMVNTEYKFFDTQATTNVDYTGSLNILNSMAQGQTDVTRIGDSIKVQNLVVRGAIASSAVATSSLRMMIIWDPQNKTTTTADVLEYVGSVYAPFSPKDYDKRFQTKVLYDRVHSLVPTAESALTHFDYVIPINQHTQFEGASTTINSGALKMLIISSSIANLPVVVFQARISYTDN